MSTRKVIVGALTASAASVLVLPSSASAATFSANNAIISIDSFGRATVGGSDISHYIGAGDMQAMDPGDINNCTCLNVKCQVQK